MVLPVYHYLGVQDLFVYSGAITARSASKAFEGRKYYCLMRIHKEEFAALVQRGLEDMTNKFELIHSHLSNILKLQ